MRELAVAPWFGEIGRPGNGHAEMSFLTEQSILYWKWEEGPQINEGVPTPGDLGPAWVVQADATERTINGGDWITRAEAERLAEVGKHTLDAEA
jgi:hypothetical protein